MLSVQYIYLLFVLYSCYLRFVIPGATQVAEQVNWLFLDMNSYFASVEQEVQPHLRGKPTAVVTVDADSTVCIAASYEAKAYGVSTGTALGEARRKCPDLNVVVARHEIYVDYHKKIQKAVEENCLHVSKIISIDEMECRLRGRDTQISNAQELARQVKQAIHSVGKTLRCSIGLAPNRFLAKVGSNMNEMYGAGKFDRLAQVMDTVNAKYGSTTLYLGGIHKVREAAPPRITFKSIPDMNLK
jgi:DNA polymerase-4